MKKATQEKILQLVRDNYNSIAADFNQTRKKPLWPELIAVADKVESGEKVLDAACGNGRLLEAFKNKSIEYLGLDNSEKLIELARENYPEKTFLIDDLLTLEKAPAQNFDWVFCVAALHHLPGKDLRRQVLKGLANKLKPNGKLIITVWRPNSHQKLLKAVRRNFWRKIFFLSDLDFGDTIFNWEGQAAQGAARPRYYHVFSERELKALLTKTGLKIENFHKDSHNFFVVLKH